MTDNDLVERLKELAGGDWSDSLAHIPMAMMEAADVLEQYRADAARDERVNNELRMQLVSEQWQPIETAPHEERVLLGWDQLGTWFCETGMASRGWRRNGISTMSWHGFATHWQPLPAPPALTDELREALK